MGILGESIAATLNPQLAAWSHSPLAVETGAAVDRRICAKVRALQRKRRRMPDEWRRGSQSDRSALRTGGAMARRS